MHMRMYAILLNNPSKTVSKNIEQKYKKPSAHKINDTIYLVRTADLASDISKKVGLDGKNEEKPLGLVARLNSTRAGYNLSDLWEWFDIGEER